MSTENEHRELIVKKRQQFNNPDRGDVDILFVSSGNGKSIGLPSISEFPTKGIFISKEFESINKQFKDGELFRLQQWKESEESIGYSPESHHHHWAFGSAVKSVESSAFIPIYKGELPDFSTGNINIPVLPVNKAFFIKNVDHIYGPFVANVRGGDEKVKVSQYPQTILTIQHHFILKIDAEILETSGVITPTENKGDFQYITSLRALAAISKEYKEEVDFISDEQLIAYFSKLRIGKKTILSKKETEKLKEGIAYSVKKRALKDDDSRVIRLKSILDDYLTKSDIGDDLINDYLGSREGEVYVKTYIEKKPNSFSSKASDELSDAIEVQQERLNQLKIETQNQIRVQRERIEDEKKKAGDEVEDEKKKAEELILAIRKKTQEDLQDEQKEALGGLQGEIVILQSEKEGFKKDIDAFYNEQTEIKKLKEVQARTNYLNERHKELEQAVNTQRHLLSSPELGGKITEVKTVIDMLQGRSLDQRDEKYEFTSPPIADTIPDQANQYIQTLVEYFENDGHSITFEEITNLLVNIQQSFLTVLSGLPGTGKTSSVMRLSTAQRLSTSEESGSDCFLNVPVARGWVSSRDFVGFNNSLKGVFQPAKTGVYQFLRKSEQKNSNELLRMVLLDEANLSPIEHYWSEFLAMCDKEGRNRPLDTGLQGSRRYLKVAENIRFIATINNDSTTEPLSPRLCDRVPVITMDIPYIESAGEHVASLSLNGAIPYTLLNDWFGMPKDTDFSTPSLISEFCEQMNAKNSDWGAAIYISQRKLNAMTIYYEKASQYIEHAVAIDFAISQHALPLICGHGKEFRQRLEGLEELAKNNNLERTSVLLQNILKAGETYIDSYSFF